MAISIFAELLDLIRQIRDVDGKIQAHQFLEVCRHIVPITERFGTSFMMIKSDINGNITRLETARQKDPQKFNLLFSIVLDEVQRGQQGGTYSDTKGLLWLKRALEFIEALLQRLYSDRQVSMSIAASDAYTQTLYQFHTWYTAAAFTVALKLVPSRETFFEKLNVTSESEMQEMEAFLQAFKPVLADIQAFLKQHNLDDPTRV